MQLDTFTNEDNFYRWETIPTKPKEGEEPCELYLKIPSETDLLADMQTCQKKELLRIKNDDEKTGKKQRKVAEKTFHVDRENLDYAKFAKLCAEKYVDNWRGLTQGSEKTPVQFDKEILIKHILPRPGIAMWLINVLFGLSEDFSVYSQEQTEEEKKIS